MVDNTEQISAKLEHLQKELTEAKEYSRDHRDSLNGRLTAIELKIAQLNGGWRVLFFLGSILAGVLAVIAATVTIMKGIK